MIRSYDELLQTADAYAKSRTLITGVELDIFTHLGKAARTASEVARAARINKEGALFLLNALTGLGLLKKQGNRFRNTPLSRTYLDASQPKSVTNFLWLAGQHWEDWMDLSRSVRKGRTKGSSQQQDDPAFRKRFAKALHERSQFLIPKITRHLNLRGTTSLLDLGGGAGSYAFALLRKTPGLYATIFDRPVAAKVALAQAQIAGHQNRVQAIGGDLFKDSYGGPYDTVFYSNVIHIYNAKENLRILKKLKRAMNPGAKLIIVEYFMEQDQTRPPDAALFNLMMYLFTPSGRCYTWQEITQWLQDLGFTRFRRTRVTEKIGILQCRLG